MGAYRVTAPYVTLKVKDLSGATVIQGYYQGAVVSDVDPESLAHHLSNDMLEVVEDAPDEAADEPGPADGKVDDILEAVGDDKEKAAEVLAAEQAKAKPRPTLVAQLEAVIAADDA